MLFVFSFLFEFRSFLYQKMVKLINDFATHECSHGPRKCDCNYLLRTDTFKNICQVLLVLIFIWVLFIVFSQIYYLFYTIYLLSPLHSFYIPFNTSITRHQLLLTSMKWIVAENTKIPCHIHQTWKTNNLSTYPLRNSHERWKAWYPEPECRVTLWTDASLSELIELEYPWLWPTYSSYLHPIQKADIGRLAVLHYYGGIHADLDVDPSVVNFHYLRKFSLVLPRDSADKMVTNHFIMAEKGSKFLNYALYGATGRNVWIFIPYLEIFWSTGTLSQIRFNFLRTFIYKRNVKKIFINTF